MCASPGCKSARMILSIKKKIFLCAAEEVVFVKRDFKHIKLPVANVEPTNVRLNKKKQQKTKTRAISEIKCRQIQKSHQVNNGLEQRSTLSFSGFR